MLKTLLRLASRNTLRHRVRTGLTAGMVVFGVALLVIALAWIKGVFTQMIGEATAMSGHVRVVAPEYAEREELMPLYANVPQSDPVLELLSKQPGVRGVEARIVTGVTVTVGEEIGDVFAMAVGADDSYLKERVKAHEKLVAGGWFTGAGDELIAGESVAQQAGAKVGDELVLLGMTQDGSLSPIKGKLVGIVKGNSFLDQQVFVPLEKMRWLADIPEGATELLVFADSYTQGDALAARLGSVAGLEGYSVQSWSQREPWASMTGMVEGMQSAIILVIVLLTALGIWNTMMMSVLERTHEIGVLRAMGLTRLGAVGLFVVEAVAIAVVGGLAGVGLGALPAWWLDRHGFNLGEQTAANMSIPVAETVHAQLDLKVVATAFALGLVMAVLGSVLPALRAASIQPVSAMRSGR